MRIVTCAAVALTAVAGTAVAQNTASMPPQTSTFGGNVRGYYFTAPIDFRITGLNTLAPDNSPNRLQSTAIIRFDGNTPPPLFPTTTNDFQDLGTFLDAPLGFIPVDITIRAGEVIGIYGFTTETAGGAGTNSYGNDPLGNTTTVFGNTIELFRSGMQFPLTSSNPANSMMHDVWAEGTTNTSNISRVEFMYDVIPAPGTLALLGLGGLVATRRRR